MLVFLDDNNMKDFSITYHTITFLVFAFGRSFLWMGPSIQMSFLHKSPGWKWIELHLFQKILIFVLGKIKHLDTKRLMKAGQPN